MYLEGIFIGGDIRAQLPEEAKKFDQIDKTFKRVCFFKLIMTRVLDETFERIMFFFKLNLANKANRH